MAEERVGLVLAGGGARGAYEVGALSVLLPALEACGQRPTVLVGTSVGAINVAYLAANADLSADDAVAGGSSCGARCAGIRSWCRCSPRRPRYARSAM